MTTNSVCWVLAALVVAGFGTWRFWPAPPPRAAYQPHYCDTHLKYWLPCKQVERGWMRT